MIEENEYSSRVMAERLEELASAIQVCAQHLESHTSAVISLSEASQEMRKGAEEQNKILSRLRKL